jgi:uncharacterized protein (TIGR00266 family)
MKKESIMKYEIIGGNLPAVLCKLTKGEKIICEGGSMSWMDDAFTMETSGGGLKKLFGKAFSGESLFSNIYTANRDAEIAFASSFPGEILAVKVEAGKGVIAQKKAFLACESGVEMSVHFQRKVAGGFFGGEGFVMEKFSGNGIVFLEVDGSTKEYVLAPGERKILDTGYLVMMDDTCSLDVETVKGMKNKLLGGEGLFNTVITGPGRIVVQTMPIAKTAMLIYDLIPHAN